LVAKYADSYFKTGHLYFSTKKVRQLQENKIPTNPVVELVETWG